MKVSRQILIFELIYSIALFLFSISFGNISETFDGFLTILCSPAQLTSDYFFIGTISGTFLNATIVGFSCVLLQFLFKANLTGTSMMAFFLTVGFSFFGINFLNIWPCFLGTWLFSVISRKPFSSYLNLALFSTALAPFVSEMIFVYPGIVGLCNRIFLGILIGCIAGFLLPILSFHGPNLHKGYSLYNAASVAGFIGIFLFSFLYRFKGIEIPNHTILGNFDTDLGLLFCLGTCIFMIAFGFIMNGRSFKGYEKLMKATGYQCDFTSSFNFGLTLMNIGMFGLSTAFYYILIHAPFFAPTIGSMICLLALTSCGVHILNMLPIMLGYILISFFGSLDLNSSAMIVGLCFSASLVPISGRFGSISGVVAGMLHAIMVTTVVTFHGGFVLYNGGFTAGIVAMIFVPILEYFFIPADHLTCFPQLKSKTTSNKKCDCKYDKLQ